jgi:type II secretory pathway pseudopilin PulG
LIVVAIILIIASIAIPNFLRAKIAANEASAVGSMRSLTTACASYETTYGQFPAALADLGPISSGGTPSSTSADLIDSVLAAGSKSGYTFAYTSSSPYQTYTITATPIVVGQTGQRMFFADQSNVIRADSSGAGATAASTPIG